jgi:hypothetical protein
MDAVAGKVVAHVQQPPGLDLQAGLLPHFPYQCPGRGLAVLDDDAGHAHMHLVNPPCGRFPSAEEGCLRNLRSGRSVVLGACLCRWEDKQPHLIPRLGAVGLPPAWIPLPDAALGSIMNGLPFLRDNSRAGGLPQA